MKTVVSIYEAKTQLSRLIGQVLAGDEVVISNRGVEVVAIIPVKARGEVVFGALSGKWDSWDPSEQDQEFAEMFDQERF